MATGDQNDIFSRIRSMLPRGWFGANSDPTNIVNAVITGASGVLSFFYSLYVYAKAQTRIATATGGWLDMISADFFGTGLPRNQGETDASFRSRIMANLTREKATRNGISQALYALTGRMPVIVEPWRPLDCGAYGNGTAPLTAGVTPGYGYNTVGAYGSMILPAQAFITAYRPKGNSSFGNIGGYGVSVGGYAVASQLSYMSMTDWTGGITDADIYACVAATKAEGTIMWVRISD